MTVNRVMPCASTFEKALWGAMARQSVSIGYDTSR